VTTHEGVHCFDSSSEDEDRSITRAFPLILPCSNTGEQGLHEEISDGDSGGGGDPNGVGGEVLTCWMKDFPLQRESVNASCISYPPLVVSRERERKTLRNLERWDATWLSAQDKEDIYSP
jgi:hypothetical protein